MGPLAILIVMLFLSLIVVRIATVALVLTGLTRQEAQFQARSAWTGTGFTTREAEDVVNHPVRRRIIMLLMLVRNAGFVAALSTLILSFVQIEERGQGLLRLGIIAGALVVLWLIARSDWADRWLNRIIARGLKRWTDLDVRDYAGLLHLVGEYAVAEMMVRPDGWLAGRTLADLRLPEEGVLALGVEREGHYIGAPRGDLRLEPGDTVLLYGRSGVLADLDRRSSDAEGERRRAAAVAEQRSVAEQEGAEASARRAARP